MATIVQPIYSQDHLRGRNFLYGLAVLLALSVLGFVYKTAAGTIDRQSDPLLGQILDVDGHAMHILCMGEGSPTVILEAAGGQFSAAWAWVQPVVAQSTRVCAYDRAGYGRSDSGPGPRDAHQIATELHALLSRAEIKPPYVLVGHGIGGMYTRVYNAQYPGEVVGMVLLDATHPDNWTRHGESVEALRAMAGISRTIARVGMMQSYVEGQTSGLPRAHHDAIVANMSSSRYWDSRQADTAATPAMIEQTHAAGSLGDLPLVVLAALTYPEGPGRETERALQMELAALSTNSIYEEIAGAGHMTFVTSESFAQVVNAVIVRFVEAARLNP